MDKLSSVADIAQPFTPGNDLKVPFAFRLPYGPYQAAQNMARDHFIVECEQIDP